MAKFIDHQYTFDDVILNPQRSKLISRSEVDLSRDLGLFNLNRAEHPLISSNMDSITEFEMALAIGKNGGMGVLHRYKDPEIILNWVKELNKNKVPAIPSIGIQKQDLDLARKYEQAGATMICVDVAHGDQEQVYKFIETLSDAVAMPIMAGNIVDALAAYDLYNCGADFIRVGVGSGSSCSTRVMTGHGKPQLSAILDVDLIRRKYNSSFMIVSDGGIKTPGDCVKALAAGADFIMSGFIFAGCDETPWFDKDGRKIKIYRGMASAEAQEEFRGKINNYTPEGVTAGEIACTGPVEHIIKYFLGGIRSGLSYSGVKNITKLQENAIFAIITANGHYEGTPNILNTLR